MRAHYSKRFSILLVLLVLGHELNHVFVTNALNDGQSKQTLDQFIDKDEIPRKHVIAYQDNELAGIFCIIYKGLFWWELQEVPYSKEVHWATGAACGAMEPDLEGAAGCV